MLKTIRSAVIGFIALALSSIASAQGLDTGKLFFGAGLSSNEVSGSDSGTGFQIFAGYGLAEVAPKVFIDAEVGYMDTGDMSRGALGDVSANGLWATVVGRYMISPTVELIGRLGLDFGDDDGLVAGIGVGFLLTRKVKLRLEYVQRDNVDSVQFNLVYRP